MLKFVKFIILLVAGLVTCEHGGTQWTDGNCYLVQAQIPTTWSGAQDLCGEINATLVSIESEEKLKFMRDGVLSVNRFVYNCGWT